MVTGFAARRTTTYVVGALLVLLLIVLVGVATVFARPVARTEATIVQAVIGGALLLAYLNATLPPLWQRVMRTVVAGGAAGLALLLLISSYPFAAAGVAAALLLMAVRQWFSEATALTVRDMTRLGAGIAIVAGAGAQIVALTGADPTVAGAVACVTAALAARVIEARLDGRDTAESAAHLAMGFFLVAATTLLVAPPLSGPYDVFGFVVNLTHAWRQAGAVLLVGTDLALGVLLTGRVLDSTVWKRAATVIFVITLNAVALASLDSQIHGASSWLLLGVAEADLAIGCGLASRWLPTDHHLAEPIRLLSSFIAIAAADMLILWITYYLPDAGASSAKKLLFLGDAGAILHITSQWMPSRLGYFIRRVVLGAITILLITFFAFYLTALLPDAWYKSILEAAVKAHATPAQLVHLQHQLGVDAPIFVQYLVWLDHVLALPPDLGYSYAEHQAVGTIIFGQGTVPWFETRVGATVLLLGGSYLLQLIIALPVGVISAVRPYSRIDNFVTAFSFIGISLPNYWFGSLLIFFFAEQPFLNGHGSIFPAGGEFTDPSSPSVLDLLWHLFLPVIVLAVQGIAVYARYVRSSMLDVMSQDYVRTARAKGMSSTRVILGHGFRNSLLPLITLVGIDLPQIFVGAIVTEFVFNWPGMGYLSVTEVQKGNVAVVIGILLILSVLVVLGSVIADLCYTIADPRIKYDEA